MPRSNEGGERGKQTRDFIHITDLIRAIRKAAEVEGVGGETFQIASAFETTVSEMTEKLVTAMQAEGMNDPAVFYGPKRDGDVARNYSDTTKGRQQLNWQPDVSLEDGLRRTVRFFQQKGSTRSINRHLFGLTVHH